jgi:hypothetical protein
MSLSERKGQPIGGLGMDQKYMEGQEGVLLNEKILKRRPKLLSRQ